MKSFSCFCFVSLFFASLACFADDADRVDPSTMHGKMLCGYQGWFTGDGTDGSKIHWMHQGNKPEKFGLDIWPDVSELDEDEKYATEFRYPDGSPAYLFSSMNEKTVVRHFKWMQDYGIDGVFLQHFMGYMRDGRIIEMRKIVMSHVRKGAEKHGRCWALMYDIAGLKEEDIETHLIPHWKEMVDTEKIRQDSTYLHHDGKPVLGIWGVGFANKATPKACDRTLDFFKNDPKYGGNFLVVGVPARWRQEQTPRADHLPKFLNDNKAELRDGRYRWLSHAGDMPHWAVLNFPEPIEANVARIVSGDFGTDDATEDFVLQYEKDGDWIDINETRNNGNTEKDRRIEFPLVKSSKFRLWITKTPKNQAGVWELALYRLENGLEALTDAVLRDASKNISMRATVQVSSIVGADPVKIEAFKKADVIFPWTVGGYRTAEKFQEYFENNTAADIALCKERGQEYMPTVWPGFSWHNLMKGRGNETQLAEAPRRKGQHLIEQIKAHLTTDCRMMYVAMFDEMDEATCILKTTDNPPPGTPLLDMEGQPSDRYLKIVGYASKALKKNEVKNGKHANSTNQ